MPSSKLMSWQHRRDVQTKHTSLLPVYESGARCAWGDMTCFFFGACGILWSTALTSLISSPFLPLSAPLSVSGSIKGRRAYCQGRTNYRNSSVLFLWTVNVFKQERRKETVAYKWNVKTERTRAYLINFQTENSPGRNKWREADSANEQMERANRVYRDKFEAGEREKWATENMWDCNTLNTYEGCLQHGSRAEDQAETFITYPYLRIPRPTHSPAWLVDFVPYEQWVELSQQAPRGLVDVEKMNRWGGKWPWEEWRVGDLEERSRELESNQRYPKIAKKDEVVKEKKGFFMQQEWCNDGVLL